jgi:hypothetical protein
MTLLRNRPAWHWALLVLGLYHLAYAAYLWSRP